MNTELIQTNNSLVIGEDLLKGIKKLLDKSTKQHKRISQTKTPVNKEIVGKKGGYDYVKDWYMRSRANKEFPGWSFTIIKDEIVGSPALPKSMALKVHGRLKWFDNGIWREGDMIAAHRIQFKKDKEGNPTDEVVDMGNDFKSAVTDCMKKALNTYMNIADDIYRKADPELTDDEKFELIEAAKNVNVEMENQIKIKIENMDINKQNFEPALRRLEKLKNDTNKS